MTGADPERVLSASDCRSSLIDFLSRMGIELGISPKLCKEVAMQRRFLNRATRYAELEYDENNDEAIIAQLLEIESQFQVREIDHAVGLLQLTSATVTEFAELGDWHANLQGYDALLLENPKDTVAAKGVVRVRGFSGRRVFFFTAQSIESADFTPKTTLLV